MNWRERYSDRFVTPEEAVSRVQPGEAVEWACFMEPPSLIQPLVDQRERLRGTRMVHETPTLAFPWFDPGWHEHFTVYDNYPSIHTRPGVRDGHVHFVPWPFGFSTLDRASLAERQNLFAKPDVYLVKVSEPDGEGYCSFGHWSWFSPVAVQSARLVIAEMGPQVIRTCGQGARVHISELDCLVPAPPPGPPPPRALPPTPPDEAEKALVIGAYAAELVQDGDTFEVGIGPAAEAMVEHLRQRHDLGIHSELVFPSMVELVRMGVVTGRHKNIHPGKVVCGALFFYPGDPEAVPALEFVRENPAFEFRSIGYVANVATIAAHENIVAVNNILGIDLTGQAVVNNLGTIVLSGIGGNQDFTIGTHYARGGRSVHCLMTTAKEGTVSRIVPQHPAGAVISIPRTYVDYLVTEYGVANLEGRSLRERAEAIIAVAHPDFRGELRSAARKLGLL